MSTQADLFHDDCHHAAASADLNGALQFVACTFSPIFWREVVARMVKQAADCLATRLVEVDRQANA